ncbi:FixH family protein [Roseobacter sp. YSTF-M11]|uniref:FixH family protein n=1 Tax=Roseobacter insulae TaxID=2859783 RepID=A0A9X1JZI3_9RHOB|nr:FixH family protein [Roseobacter insulae]MBW4709335.1 FixH family protein [Roseobacter insulae]
MTPARQLTGRHVAIMFVSAFTVIIGVNLLLAYSAVKTFPGLEVKNSYVASQHFDRDREAQTGLGWSVSAQARGGEVILSITDKNGDPVDVASLEATLGRATHVRDDQSPEFVFDGRNYVASTTLAEGNWNLRMIAQAKDGTAFRQRVLLNVPRERK